MKTIREQLMDVSEVQRCFRDRSIAHCYRIIRKLNAELEAQGYLTENGRISRAYLYKRYHMEA